MKIRSVLVRFVLPVVIFPLAALAEVHWSPVAPEDLAEKTSKTGADIEILSSQTVLDGMNGDQWVASSKEAKIYTKSGVDRVSILHINYGKTEKIWDVGARVVKPDGTAVELTKKDFIESTVAKKSGLDVRQTSFAFRGLEPGDVVQFQWKTGQTTSKWAIAFEWFYTQEEVPVRLYELKVLRSNADLNVIPFNCPNIDVKNPNHSGLVVRIKDQPAFVEENEMPPERDFRGWICLVYTDKFLRQYSNTDAWETIGSQTAEAFRLDISANEAMRTKARELTADAKTPEEKLVRLAAYCKSEFINFDWVKNAGTMQDREKRDKLEDTQAAEVTFKKTDGYSGDINRLFAALARALKFEVRHVMSISRDDLTQMKTAKGYVFMNRASVAVKVNDKWEVYNPGDYLAQPEMLGTQDEGAMMLICDEDKSFFMTPAPASAEKTKINRKGTFSLDADGNLEGDIEIRYGGHAAVELKKKWWGETESDSLKGIQDQITSRISGAELTDFKVTNLSTLAFPVIVNYHVKVSGYAESTGTRLIVMPDFFEVGRVSPFVAETRNYPIMFKYASETHDDITLNLPEGYTFDAPSAPRNVSTPKDIVYAQYSVAIHPKAHNLVYRSTKVIGSDGSILFGKESYPILKKLFEGMEQSDHHNFILKPIPAPVAASTANPGAQK